MAALNLPSLPVLAMHKSNRHTHAKLWESLSGKTPLLFHYFMLLFLHPNY